MRDLKCTHTPRHDYTKVWESEVNDACSSRATMFKDTSTGINNVHIGCTVREYRLNALDPPQIYSFEIGRAHV